MAPLLEWLKLSEHICLLLFLLLLLVLFGLLTLLLLLQEPFFLLFGAPCQHHLLVGQVFVVLRKYRALRILLAVIQVLFIKRNEGLLVGDVDRI